MKRYLLSIIICTYNRSGLLKHCLDSLFQQNFSQENFEVIIVDNNSTDRTKEVVTRYVNKIPNLNYVFEKNQGLSYARNRGYDVAQGEYLVYLDDDTTAPPDYLSNIQNVIKKYTPDILGGPLYPYYATEKPFWFKDEYEIRKYENNSGFSLTCRVSGGNFTIKTNILKKLGLFDVELGIKGDKLGLGEDAKVIDLYRANLPEKEQKIYYALECYVNHHVPRYKMKMQYMLTRSYLSGKMFIKLGTLNNQRKIIKEIRRAVLSPFLQMVKEIAAKGVKDTDYIFACLNMFRSMGIITEGVNQLYKRARFSKVLL